MWKSRYQWTPIWFMFSALRTNVVRCNQQHWQSIEEHKGSCSVGDDSTTKHSTATLLSYPPASDTSTSVVQELLLPFSLTEFAQEFWERKPLVIRGRSPQHYSGSVGFGIGDVESVIENGVALAGEEEHMALGSDWNIIKRVFVEADGEFWTAALPPSNAPPSNGHHQSALEALQLAGASEGESGAGRAVSLEETRSAFLRGGFSVVINRLQRRWREVSEVSLALEDVLGQPVNANLYMTPPNSQGFEAHFDWMDGIVVQLAGSKTWILYDEMVPAPRADLKYKPAAGDLGEPIAVLELNPGDLMYIPRGWPHEAAVNGTAEAGKPTGARGPSLHVTFGIESALSGTWESLLHHALEVAAIERPHMFAARRQEDSDEGSTDGQQEHSSDPAVGKALGIPWLELLHVWVHDMASREERLRKAVPLAPLFSGQPPGATAPEQKSEERTSGACGTEETPAAQASPTILREFRQTLEVCRAGGADPDTAPNTLKLLDSLSAMGSLERVVNMFAVGPREGGSALGPGDEVEAAEKDGNGAALFRTVDWRGLALEAFDRTLFAKMLAAKIEEFVKVASPEGALQRMVLAATIRARGRAAGTQRDLARCGQGPRPGATEG